MCQSLLIEQVPIVEKILRTVLVYLVIIVLFRITGKRGMAAMNTLDFVVLFLLSNVVQNAIIGPDYSLVGGVLGAVVLVALNSGVNRVINLAVERHPRVARLLDGSSTTVIEDGSVDASSTRRLGIRRSELDHAVRLQHADDIADIADGQLDPSGRLLLTLKPAERSATKADVEARRAQLDRLESLLATR
ncbi:YetF domain-containing protein [Tersicoccus sp. MR15.9]|uniref:DUF421 domain-containing protein n=1 Tax=Tersicoccus mangrovi TaxID=3121635 RepID=UPI002FE5A6EC